MPTDDELSRARSALDELEQGEMSVQPNGDGTFQVKDYTVDIQEISCECPDHEYNERFCKHIVAARLQAMWGNIDVDVGVGGGNSDPPKPDVLDPRFDNVPEYLRGLDQWVCWEQKLHENKDGSKRWTKVPVAVDGSGFASSTDPETWGTFTEAVGQYNATESVVGIGLVIGDEYDDIIGVDIDDCREPETGELDSAIHEVLDGVDSYAEVSPSGTGIRLFLRGVSSAPGHCEAELPGEAHIEKYVTGRYLTVTGHQLVGQPDAVENDESAIAKFDSLTTGTKVLGETE